MKKSKILSLILCAVLVIAFATFDASAATTADLSQKEYKYSFSGNETISPNTNVTVDVISPDGTCEKDVDDKYYSFSSSLNSGNYLYEAKPNLNCNGDIFISLDFKLTGTSTFYFQLVPLLSETSNAITSTYKWVKLLRVANSGISEVTANGILGSDTATEKWFTDKVKQNRWNSLQIEICAAANKLNVWLNGEKAEIPVKDYIVDSNVNCDLQHGVSCIQLMGENMNAGTVNIDNGYIQCGVKDAVSPYSEEFKEVAEDGTHPGHLGTISEHMITDAAPTITAIEGAILRDGQLPHYDTSGNYVAMVGDTAVRKHYYLEPSSAVNEAVANTTTSNDTNVSFWNEALTTKYTDKLPCLENCVALIPVKDGGNKVRTFVTYDAADIITGPFELGLSDASATHKSKYAIVGFNPQIKEDLDKVRSLYDTKTLVIPDKFAGINVQCVKHYAFYTPAESNNGVEITYPDIDFDLSQVVSSDRCWPGQYSFAKTGIKKVAFSTKGKEGAWMQTNAFEGCEKLTDVDLTNCKGGQATVFKDCKNLTTVKADDLSAWAWGGTGQAFVGCEKLEELTFNLAHKSYIDHELLQNAASLKTIKIMDATASNSLANKVALYAAAYDGTGDNKKLVEVSVLKKVNDSDNFRTLAIPQNGVSVKIFQLSADGKLIPYLVQGKTTPVTITIK